MPKVRNPGLGAGQQALLVATVNLRAADIAALNTIPFQLLPPPGAGKLLIPFSFAFIFLFGTRKYFVAGGGTDACFARYSPSLDATGMEADGLITATGSAFSYSGTFPANLSILPGDDNSPLVINSTNGYVAGPITAATLNAGGAGYAPNDTGTISTGTGDATYKVLTVGGGGAVLTFQVTSGGTAYEVANNRATAVGGAQPGVGTGFIVNITAVQSGDGTLKVVTYYQIIPVP